MAEEADYIKLKGECLKQAWQTFGYMFLFDKRAQKLNRYINLLKVFGISIPALIGFTFLAHEYFAPILTPARYVAIIGSGIQFLFSIFAVIYKWDDELAYSYEASQAYNDLYDKFKKLANYPPKDFINLTIEFDLLMKEWTARSKQDGKHNIREWERRRAMRYTLREHQIPCAAKCMDNSPLDMKSTDCPVCGKFSFRFRFFNL